MRHRELRIALLGVAIASSNGCGKVAPLTGKSAGSTDAETADAQVGGIIIPAIQCSVEKTPPDFVASVTQDLFGRAPTDAESARGSATFFDAEHFVDDVLARAELDSTLGRVASTLFETDTLQASAGASAEEAALIEDLKLEAAVLVQKNREMPWSAVFSTTVAFCTQRTALLYGAALTEAPDTQGFAPCQLPPERAGVMSLVSVLRATSPANNPQAFYALNNNYRRAAAALYWLRGIEHKAGVHGDAGSGPSVPPDACVPVTDMREFKGRAFGTASVSLSGPNCAGCHSHDEGPLSVAFRRFDADGSIVTAESVDRLAAEDRNGSSAVELKAILFEQHSCWSSDDGRIAEQFVGMPGFAAVAARSPALGHALSLQLPRILLGKVPDDNLGAAIEDSFGRRGRSLVAALRGLLLSKSYRCVNPGS